MKSTTLIFLLLVSFSTQSHAGLWKECKGFAAAFVKLVRAPLPYREARKLVEEFQLTNNPVRIRYLAQWHAAPPKRDGTQPEVNTTDEERIFQSQWKILETIRAAGPDSIVFDEATVDDTWKSDPGW